MSLRVLRRARAELAEAIREELGDPLNRDDKNVSDQWAALVADSKEKKDQDYARLKKAKVESEEELIS